MVLTPADICVHTETGSVYEFGGSMRHVRRIEFEHGLRRDTEWPDLLETPVIEVGRPMSLLLEPLGYGDVTVRTTGRVTKIEWVH